MLTVEHIQTDGWSQAIRGMRNPMNSWDRSDSGFAIDDEWIDYIDINNVIIPHVVEGESGPVNLDADGNGFFVGPNDKKLMKQLRDAGKDHAKYRRMITIWCDICAPLYWWKEFDTYKVGTVANSCSTMHKIAEKEFTFDDFSCEHLSDFAKYYILGATIHELNVNRREFLLTGDKQYWWNMIQLLPSSYNQRRTVMLNYEVLSNIYPARRNHKLDEWHTLCDIIEELPESWIITGKDEE